MTRPSPKTPVVHASQRQTIRRVHGATWETAEDRIAREEPLEIRLRFGTGDEKRLGLVMRTPGHDQELVTGLLFAEGIVERATDIRSMDVEPASGETQEFNSILVTLRADLKVAWERVERPLVMTSACGVCGRAMLSHLQDHAAPARGSIRVSKATIVSLPDKLRQQQSVFEETGGLHAAALFTSNGALESLREDVGRHNAVDKVVGAAFCDRRIPLSKEVLLVSGRAGYEIVQKAVRAGIPVVAAVGAPSSLALETAKEFDLTLVGFLRGDRFNVYSSPERVTL